MELIGLRTANSKTFDIGAGKMQCEIYGVACHYKDNYDSKLELWKDIDLTIRDGKLTTAPYELTIDGLTITVRCKQTGLVTTLTLSKIGTSSISTAKPEYTFKNNKATFADIALDTDLEILASNEQVKFTRVLKSDKAPLDAELDVKQVGEGLRLYYQAVDADNNQLKVTTEKVGDKVVEQILTADLLFTNMVGEAKTAKYPIKIDPILSLSATENANMYQYLPDNPTDTPFLLDNSNGYLRHGLAKISTASIPVGAVLSAATLSFYIYAWFASRDAAVEISCRRITTAWVETQVSWNHRTTADHWSAAGGDFTTTDMAVASTVHATLGWLNFNVLGLTQDAIANRSNILDVLLRYTTESGTSCSPYMYNKDYAVDPTRCPKLVVTFEYALPPRVNYYPHILAH